MFASEYIYMCSNLVDKIIRFSQPAFPSTNFFYNWMTDLFSFSSRFFFFFFHCHWAVAVVLVNGLLSLLLLLSFCHAAVTTQLFGNNWNENEQRKMPITKRKKERKKKINYLVVLADLHGNLRRNLFVYTTNYYS